LIPAQFRQSAEQCYLALFGSGTWLKIPFLFISISFE
jgi:hypothetical protein